MNALRPAILWNDQRTEAECRAIEAAVGGRGNLVNAVGNAALPGFTLPKLLWVRANEPEIYARTSRFCLPKDYIALCLTGELATDVGDAAGTLLLNVLDRTWSTATCNAVDIDPNLLARLIESCAPVGLIRPSSSEATGLPVGTPVVIGSGDNMASAAGIGVVRAGAVGAVLGTSGVIVSHVDQPVVDLDPTDDAKSGRLHTMCAADGTSSRPGGWCVTGCMLSAGGSLQWARDALFPDRSFDAMMAEASAVPSGSGGLLFLPYLTGERCPHQDPTARGGWIGLTSRHTAGHLIRAVVEGVCFGMAQIVALHRSIGVTPRGIRLTGGAAASPLWRQTLADATGTPIEVVAASEGPAFGAALMAGVGGGVFTSLADACDRTITPGEATEPSAEGSAALVEPMRAYAEAYGALRSTCTALTAIDERG